MKITKMLATVAGLAALTACGGGESNTSTENLDANLTDMNAGMDANLDMNATDMNAMDMNAGMNATDMNATGNTDANAMDAGNSTTNNTL
jgi:hypothetical protein